MTTVHTHTVTSFANPYLRCNTCEVKVVSFVSFEGQAPECTHQGELLPCGHIGMNSVCPSWSPVDGCKCKKVLGYVYHPIDKTEKRSNGQISARSSR